MKKILLSVLTIGVVAVVAVVATQAFFSDTETSVGNTFVAGALDLKVDNDSYVTDKNGVLVASPNTSWQLSDLAGHLFFNFTDLKPGDIGEDTISLHVNDNDSWLCAAAQITEDSDVDYTSAEQLDDPTVDTQVTTTDGELGSQLNFAFWADDGDNVYEDGENIFLQGPISSLGGAGKIALADKSVNVWTPTALVPFPGNVTKYIGKAWCFGTLTPAAVSPGDTSPLVRGTTGFTCNGSQVNNAAQTDRVKGDIQFYAVQSRNNGDFTCASDYAPTWPTNGIHELILENETINENGPWTIINDGTHGLLTWAGDGPTFSYTLSAQGLAPSTAYSLIYYADPYPGNNPGAFIGNGTSDGSGNLSFSGNPNLNTDIPQAPDANIALHGGGKVWLVLTADYNSGNLSTGPMTTWNPGSYLMEGNVYINYDDTDH